MPYISFVFRLLHKIYGVLVRFDPLYGRGVGKYNRQDETSKGNAPLGILATTIVGLILLGAPMVGYIWLVTALPLSPTVQWLILMGSGILALVIIGRYLLKHAAKQ